MAEAEEALSQAKLKRRGAKALLTSASKALTWSSCSRRDPLKK